MQQVLVVHAQPNPLPVRATLRTCCLQAQDQPIQRTGKLKLVDLYTTPTHTQADPTIDSRPDQTHEFPGSDSRKDINENT